MSIEIYGFPTGTAHLSYRPTDDFASPQAHRRHLAWARSAENNRPNIWRGLDEIAGNFGDIPVEIDNARYQLGSLPARQRAPLDLQRR